MVVRLPADSILQVTGSHSGANMVVVSDPASSPGAPTLGQPFAAVSPPAPSLSKARQAHVVSLLDSHPAWGQVQVRKLEAGAGYELRHLADARVPTAALRPVAPERLRELAETGSGGGFRPLRSAPDLVSGWKCLVPGADALGEALDALYPGSVADAWSLDGRGCDGVRYEEVAARQLGRAGVLRQLKGEALGVAVCAACGPGSCLKRRCWTAEGLPPDPGEGGRWLPCLEPCPMFLSFARACAGTEGGGTVPDLFAPDDLATLAAALRHALEHRPPGLRMGEVTAPLHPWRIARLLARHEATWSKATAPTQESDE